MSRCHAARSFLLRAIAYVFGLILGGMVLSAASTAANTITIIDSGGIKGDFNSIAVGADGFPVISYLDSSTQPNDHLKVAKCSNTACTGVITITTADSGDTLGYDTSIAIGLDGLPVISYLDGSNKFLKVAKCINTGCTGASTITIVDGGGNAGYYTSIAIGADGLPVISYGTFPVYTLKVAKCVNATCTGSATVTTVDTAPGGEIAYTSIVLGADDLPIISYLASSGLLKVAKCANAACTGSSTITTVDSASDVGHYSSIAMGADGLPIIGYYDVPNRDLKVAKSPVGAI
jgi:hypothetical protein